MSARLDALEKAHALGIVHRDFKPENIMLTLEAYGVVTPKLLDFGVAEILQDARSQIAARRLGRQGQPRADADAADAAAAAKKLWTKSGLMLGLGETRDELLEVFADLRAAGCDILTIGQYLAPSPRHHRVMRFVPPEEFDEIRDQALGLGFSAVAAGPFVRSSYHAEEVFNSRV